MLVRCYQNEPGERGVVIAIGFGTARYAWQSLASFATVIQFDELHMFPDRPEERTYKASQWKGKIYKSSPEYLFIESSAVQARDIHQFSRKPVLDLE